MTGSLPLPSDASVLAIVVARIGDTLLATPLLRALKAAVPQGSLSVLAHPKRVALLQHLPFIDTLGTISKVSAFWKGRLAGKRHDLAVVLGHDRPLLEYGLRCAGRVVAFETEGLTGNSRLLLVPRPQESTHAVHERLLLNRALGIAEAGLHLSYQVTPDESREAREWLAGKVAGKPLVGIQPVSFPTKSHRDWPVDSFIDLLRRLVIRFPEAGFLILGDQTATGAAQRIRQSVGEQVIVASGQFDLRRSFALISQMDLYVGVDTGPTHIAGALGIPMVALYHCSYPGRNLIPLGHPALHMIEHPATGTSGAGIERSMTEIPVDAVYDAALDLLERQAQ